MNKDYPAFTKWMGILNIIMDRVVHHALVSVLEPIYEKIFITDSYATRKNKGSHRAIRQAQVYLKKHRYFLKIDIQKYFESIKHSILSEILTRKIKDKDILALVQVIIANNDLSQNTNTGVGLPIGNLTSQFFANVYLDIFDHFVKEELRVAYIRYMDDMVFFSDDKSRLKEILVKAEEYLDTKLQLKLKEKAVIINTATHGLSFLGFRIFPNLIRVKNENIKRMKKNIKIKQYAHQQHKITEQELAHSINGVIEFVKTADSLRLRQKIFGQGL